MTIDWTRIDPRWSVYYLTTMLVKLCLIKRRVYFNSQINEFEMRMKKYGYGDKGSRYI